MKKFLVFTPVALSLAILGAHFLRSGNWVALFVTLLVIALLFVRRPWAARVIQVALVLGAFEWAHTLFELVQMRLVHGQPYLRMALILGAVDTVTLMSALLFQAPALQRIYRMAGPD